jgi:RluA family pseudouridine synthase
LSIYIIYQNQNWVAVDKPSGLSVHNNEDPQNLLKVLEKQLKVQKLYPVHRLDKETSGVQILALNDQWASTLAQEFEKRTVEKIYTGVVRGQLKEAEGSWKEALTDKAEGRKNPAGISRERVPCETRFRVLKSSKYFTLCEFNLITGRQHQIRKHAAMANHAIVGDPRYGDKTYNARMAEIYKTDRMFLHCSCLKIVDQTLTAPQDFEKLIT